MPRIIGIDLGTTNSLVAYVDERTGLPRVIPDAEGRNLLPSIVSFTPAGILVGEAARRQLVRQPASTVYSVKRFMGRCYEDVKDELCYFAFRVCDGSFEVLATNGNTRLGGDDFDRAIVLSLLDDIRERHGVYLGQDAEAMQELRLGAEAAKIRLSSEERTRLTLPFDGFTYHR